jgi:hypothetical protein
MSKRLDYTKKGQEQKIVGSFLVILKTDYNSMRHPKLSPFKKTERKQPESKYIKIIFRPEYLLTNNKIGDKNQ